MRWLVLTLLGFMGGASAWLTIAGEREPAPVASAEEPVAATSDEPPASEPEEPMLGVVVPAQEVYLAPAGFARVAEVSVLPGQPVEAGAVLARMDTRADRAELAAARAAARAAHAEMKRLRVEARRSEVGLDRAQQLQGYVPAVEVEDLRFDAQAARAGTQHAGAAASERAAQIDRITTRMADASIRAPFSGVIAQRLAEPGSTLAAGEPVLHLVSEARLVRFAVPEADAEQLYPGAVVTVAFDQYAAARGVVIAASPEIETTTRIVLAEARLDLHPDIDALIRTGTIARVTFGEPPPSPLTRD